MILPEIVLVYFLFVKKIVLTGAIDIYTEIYRNTFGAQPNIEAFLQLITFVPNYKIKLFCLFDL